MLKIFKMVNVKIRILRGLLEEAIRNIDAGNSNHTEEELSEIIDDLTKLNRGVKRISKTYACEKILHCSPSTFDTYVKLGIINETADNLLVAQVKKYPEVLGGVEIGNGTIRVKIPLIDKVIELDTNDLTAFRETLTSK